MITERYEVVKAGGWSLANTKRTRSVVSYIQSDPNRRFFVPSAPGVINDGDTKITDLLLECCSLRGSGQSTQDVFKVVRGRYESISGELGYYDLEPLLASVEQTINSASFESPLEAERARDLIASRGEWIEGHIMADVLGFRFIDPTELIRFRRDGRLDERSYAQIRNRLGGGDRFVIPGFYGLGADGRVKTLPRDGSDVSGAVVAHGVNASIYRNLTSADGVFSADPRIKGINPRVIPEMTFREYRELGNGGFRVLHSDAIVPVAVAGIPINVRNSENPDSEGTMIVPSRTGKKGEHVIGIAGKEGFVSLTLHRYGMNDEIGALSRVLQTLAVRGASINHVATGTDQISIILGQEQVLDREDEILEEIFGKVGHTNMDFRRGVGFLTIVGQGIPDNNDEVSKRLFSALHGASIKHRGFTQGDSGISSAVFVDCGEVENSIRVSHKVLIENSGEVTL